MFINVKDIMSATNSTVCAIMIVNNSFLKSFIVIQYKCGTVSSFVIVDLKDKKEWISFCRFFLKFTFDVLKKVNLKEIIVNFNLG